MPLGILEDFHLEQVPGTALLEELTADKPIGDSPTLKRGTGHSSHLILVPQPSDDPRDPLNFPLWKKEALFWSICYITGLVGAIGPLLAPGYAFLGKEWNVGVNAVAASHVNGDLVVALGCIMMLQGPIAVKFGRRPVFLFSAIVLFTCSIWSALSQGLKSFLVSRVFQGFGMAAFEALVTATIGDIYFVHQRGFRVAIWSFAIIGGINIAPIVNGYVIQSPILGWRWTFWILVIFLGIALISIVLFVPETSYGRQIWYETDASADVREIAVANKEHDNTIVEKADFPERENISTQKQTESSTGRNYLPPKTFLEEMKPWSGYVNHVNILKIMLRPFPFILSPAVLFAIITYGLTTCWLVVLSVISSVVFALPPYNFTPSQTGLVSIGPLVATVIATVIAGPLCDYSALWFAKHNNGVYEPESRLYLMLPMLIFQVAGFAFWALMQSRGVHWIGPVIMYSIINAGQSIGSTAIVTYVIDVHRKNAAECFALINFVKNMILFGFTQFSVEWVTNMGVLHTFGILAGLTALCILTTIPMYVYGKRSLIICHICTIITGDVDEF